MQKGVFLLPRWQQRCRCKEEAGEQGAVHSQLSGRVCAVWRRSGDSSEEQRLEHVPHSALQPAGMAATTEVSVAVVGSTASSPEL